VLHPAPFQDWLLILSVPDVEFAVEGKAVEGDVEAAVLVLEGHADFEPEAFLVLAVVDDGVDVFHTLSLLSGRAGLQEPH